MLSNGDVVEFISGHIVEKFKHYENEVSFNETCDVKYGAIGIIKNTHNRISESVFIKYRIQIIWNNGKLSNIIIGANEENINKLSEKDKLEWLDFINNEENKLEGDIDGA